MTNCPYNYQQTVVWSLAFLHEGYSDTTRTMSYPYLHHCCNHITKLVKVLSFVRILHHNHCKVYINTENFKRSRIKHLIISVNKFSESIGPYKEGYATEIVCYTSTGFTTWHTYVMSTCLRILIYFDNEFKGILLKDDMCAYSL